MQSANELNQVTFRFTHFDRKTTCCGWFWLSKAVTSFDTGSGSQTSDYLMGSEEEEEEEVALLLNKNRWFEPCASQRHLLWFICIVFNWSTPYIKFIIIVKKDLSLNQQLQVEAKIFLLPRHHNKASIKKLLNLYQ